MKCLLITGFEGFGGQPTNPTTKIIKYFNDKLILDTKIIGLILPVTYEAHELLIKAIEEQKPDFIICTGYRIGLPFIALERIALNYVIGPIPDNNNLKLNDVVVTENSKSMHFSRLPVVKINEALTKEGIKSMISYDNGGYVCNWLSYKLLDYIKQKDKVIPAGFIHIPITPELILEDKTLEGKPAMKQEDINKALEIIIKAVIDDNGTETKRFIKKIENKWV